MPFSFILVLICMSRRFLDLTYITLFWDCSMTFVVKVVDTKVKLGYSLADSCILFTIEGHRGLEAVRFQDGI